MPNEFAYSMLGSSLHGHNRPARTGLPYLSLSGMENGYLPTLGGKRLYYPLYSDDPAPFPDGLGFIGSAIGSFGVAANSASKATSFLSTFTSGLSSFVGIVGDVLSTITSVISGIVGFIVKHVAAVVQSVVAAAGGLLGAVTDLFTVKDDNQGKQALTPNDVFTMASLLRDKHDSLTPAFNPANLDRPMTQEERTGFARVMDQAKQKIDSLIAAVGGPGPALMIGAGVGALILLMPKR